MNEIVAIGIGYLFGSIPWALIIGLVFFKIDVRKHGSGNLGGSNAGRILGKPIGVLVGILDASKAFLAIGIALWFLDKNSAILAGLAASFGHCYPLFAKFKGGKAVSTAFGFLFGISVFITNQVVILFVIPLGLAFVLLKITKIVSLTSMIIVTGATITSFFVQTDPWVMGAMVVIDLLVIWRHRGNIERIVNKTERKITWM